MIGLDISQRSIKIVELSNDERHSLRSYCWQAVPDGVISRGVIEDEARMKEVLTEALKACRLKSDIKDSFVASIPETESFLRVVEVPRMDKSEVSEAVQWEVAQHIPFGLENVYLDWEFVGGSHSTKKNRMEVLVGAAEKRVVDPLYGLLSGLGLDVAGFELESQATVRALISPELKKRKGLLIIDLGGSATNVIIHDHKTIRFTATLQKGSRSLLNNLSQEELLAMTGPPREKVEANLAQIADKLAAELDGLAVEVHGIVEFYTGLDPDNTINEILLTGGGSNLPGLDKSFLKYFTEVHVQRGNPWVNIIKPGKKIIPPMSLRESVHFSTAIGLALRKFIR